MLARLLELIRLLQRDTAVQFVRFAAVGPTNTVLDFGVYVALTRGTDWWRDHLVLAATVSFCVGPRFCPSNWIPGDS